MPGFKSNLVSLHEDVINDTSDLNEMKISDEKGSVEKRTMTLIEKNGYHDSVYMNAAKIFQGIHTEKSKDKILVRYGDGSVTPMVTFKDEYSQRVSYGLAFNALKYQDLLEEMLLDSCVYPCHSIPEELTSLLVVMLYDLQDRKFRPRGVFDEEEPVPEVRKIECYLYRFKTKLAAALARCRIKHDALSIENLLPEAIREQQQRTSALPLYVWINTFKISLEDVFGDLKNKGFTRVQSVSDFDCYTYCMDQHCPDVLVFPSSVKEELLNLDLFADCKLLLQDKSRSLAVHSAQALLNTGDDIIVAHVGSPLTIAHMSALTIRNTSNIFVCGVKSSAKADELGNLFSHMECKNIRLLHEDFTEIGSTDPRLENVRVILLLPQCSGLGVGNPIDFIVNEHGDAGFLRDFFRGSVSEDKLNVLAERQLNELMHAMKFNKVQAIVYCTCSLYPEENELVVKKALESEVLEENKVQPYRLIPPIFSTCSNSVASTEIFFKIEPSEVCSGCFLAVLEREKESPENMSDEDILARAAAKGLLDGTLAEKSKKKKKKQPKVTQRRRNIAGAEFLHHQTLSNIKAELSVSKAVSNIQLRSMNGTNCRVELKKSLHPLSDAALPGAPKYTVQDRQTLARKARTERKRMETKTVDIVFPSAVAPHTPHGNSPKTSSQHCCHAAKAAGGRMFPPPKVVKPAVPRAVGDRMFPLPKVVKPAVPSHPRPWIPCSWNCSTFRKDVKGAPPAV
ncbi:putative methyltransferase NSUN7 isoform X1 [Columba livia]|uniref:putative methyltransferase NSUN7 isoform X1 n=1 Tax=Columba livia TaxID=8932 RepID=UPI000A3A8C3C|nr:putative methyltransferase NSUN7 isoform X1 [Columba livia]XP_021141681.1 putative methyltransferase NSUN7 isoform X1 [Columba livia]XP_021141682.1 putative methyltransferase NSUN7 isoform X1 [Columba livia]XP_021141683.1 putative methyltransferase NSUN7 isoform X1 [Columba livia]XP_021141684.1 putative methyltransferase NSUN7 isoform X1 [Columba livia]